MRHPLQNPPDTKKHSIYKDKNWDPAYLIKQQALRNSDFLLHMDHLYIYKTKRMKVRQYQNKSWP